MPRYNVQHPTTKKWRCFSSIVDDWITEWMDEEKYQKWRIEEYGKQAGELRKANKMSLEEAEESIRYREMMENEEDE